MPVSPALQAACDAMPKVHLTYIVAAQGKPRSKYGLGNDHREMGNGSWVAGTLSPAWP